MDALGKEFPTLTRPAEMSFRRTDIDPPSDVYIDRDDLLRFTVASLETAITLPMQLFVRMLRPNGEIIPSVHDFASTYNGLPQPRFADLGEGFLLSVMVIEQIQSNVSPFEVFVQVEIVRNRFIAPLFSQILIAGYLSQRQGLSWPNATVINSFEGPGFLNRVTGTNPAAGAEIQEIVTGVRRKLHSIKFTLVTSAAVANRRVTLTFTWVGGVFFRVHSGVTQTAGQTVEYTFAPGMPFSNADGIATVPIPNEMFLQATAVINTVTLGLQAGDDFSAPVMQVEDWLEF